MKKHFVTTVYKLGRFLQIPSFLSQERLLFHFGRFHISFQLYWHCPSRQEFLFNTSKQGKPKSSSDLIMHTIVLYTVSVQHFLAPAAHLFPPLTTILHKLRTSVRPVYRKQKNTASAAKSKIYFCSPPIAERNLRQSTTLNFPPILCSFGELFWEPQEIAEFCFTVRPYFHFIKLSRTTVFFFPTLSLFLPCTGTRTRLQALRFLEV